MKRPDKAMLPERLFVREQRDAEPELDCNDFSTKPLRPGEMAQCDTDGHYRCDECTFRNPNLRFDPISGLYDETEVQP